MGKPIDPALFRALTQFQVQVGHESSVQTREHPVIAPRKVNQHSAGTTREPLIALFSDVTSGRFESNQLTPQIEHATSALVPIPSPSRQYIRTWRTWRCSLLLSQPAKKNPQNRTERSSRGSRLRGCEWFSPPQSRTTEHHRRGHRPCRFCGVAGYPFFAEKHATVPCCLPDSLIFSPLWVIALQSPRRAVAGFIRRFSFSHPSLSENGRHEFCVLCSSKYSDTDHPECDDLSLFHGCGFSASHVRCYAHHRRRSERVFGTSTRVALTL